MKLLLNLILFITISPSFAQIEYPAPVKSTQESKATRQERAQKIIDQYAKRPLAAPPVMPKKGFGEFLMTSLARLANRVELDKVSQVLMTETFQPWNSGTEISLAGSLCKREGDYDFVLMGLIRMAYMDLESGDKLLTPEARHKLRHVLLSEKGTKHHVYFRLKKCLPIKIKDSENHIMMTEFARYLTNQILFKESGDPQYDNSKNGFEEWLLNHLAEFMRKDFDELNSRPYQGYTQIAIATLASYAEGQRVKTLATMILDYLSAKAAVQSKGLRRLAPFRRQLRHRDLTNLMQTDNGMFWYSFHSGNTEFRRFQNEIPDTDPNKEQEFFNDYVYFMAAIDKYEIPDVILDLFFDQSVPFYQKIRAREVELYYNSPSFLLSAGGRYRKVFGYFTRENDVWPMPTSIIPTNSGISTKDLFILKGDEKWKKRTNLCIAPGFACGKNLSIPRNMPEACVETVGKWKFYNLNECELKQGFYVATYEDGNNAFWEVREPEISYAQFKDTILKSNGTDFDVKQDNQYVTSDGRTIVFNWNQKSLDTYPIKSINGKAIEQDTREWAYAEGNVIDSKGDGLITIRNPVTGDKLILDHSDILNPRRSMVR